MTPAWIKGSVGAIAVLAGLLYFALGLPSGAQSTAPQILAPGEAHAKAVAGEIVLIDIRTPAEWRETGLPASAHAITMNQDARQLLAALDAATGGDRAKPVALICRTGNRSSYLTAELRKAGFLNVIDVSQGMAGSRHGPGWLKAGLPTRAGDPQSRPLLAKAP